MRAAEKDTTLIYFLKRNKKWVCGALTDMLSEEARTKKKTCPSELTCILNANKHWTDGPVFYTSKYLIDVFTQRERLHE